MAVTIAGPFAAVCGHYGHVLREDDAVRRVRLFAVAVVKTRVRREVPRLAFNQQEAAEALGISVDHFERHVKGELPVVYSGSRRLYPRKVLERWLDENTVMAAKRVA